MERKEGIGIGQRAKLSYDALERSGHGVTFHSCPDLEDQALLLFTLMEENYPPSHF